MHKEKIIRAVCFTLFILSFLSSFAADPYLNIKIKEVSMFKNGYAFLVGEAEVPGPGIYTLPEFPGAVYGTLWITPDADTIKIKSIYKENEETPTNATTYNILYVLEKGIGKTFDIRLSYEGWITAEILGTAGEEYLYAKTEKGVLIIKKSEIVGLRLKDAKGIENMARVDSHVNSITNNKIEVTEGKGKIKIRLLSQGLTWTPSYLVDISDPGEAVIRCKTLLLNNLDDITHARGNLIAGFPNIAFLSLGDPFTGPDVASVLQSNNYNFNARNIQSQNINYQSNVANFSEPVNEAAELETGEMKEDLYFFPLESLSIKRNQKKYMDLFKKRVPCRDGYTWNIQNNFDQERCEFRDSAAKKQPQEVWHTIELTNTSGIPWTTAPVLIVSKDKILGQDTLSFTNISGKTSIKITRPLDITAQLKEIEVERIRDIQAEKYPEYHLHSSYDYDLVTIGGTLEVVNRKATPINIEITKLIYGEILTTQNTPKIEKPAWDLDKENLPHFVTWDVKVEPRKKLVIEYKYRVLIRR